MRKIIAFFVALTILGILSFIVYDMYKPKDKTVDVGPEANTAESTTGTTTASNVDTPKNSPTEEIATTSTQAKLTYSNEFFQFEYPSNYTVRQESIPNSETFNQLELLLVISDTSTNNLPIKVYWEHSSLASFGQYVRKIQEDFNTNLLTKPDQTIENISFSFEAKETSGGLPVLFHYRNFDGMIGEVQEAYVWNNGHVYHFVAEGSLDFETIVLSFVP